jgi:peptidoglycan/xylan/chitin deacetylase (PgdA/CDA1 family)
MARAYILCYHKVGPGVEEGRSLNVEPALLRSHVRLFRRRGWPVLLARDYARPWPQKSVCFTFDDAYVSTMQNAPDILQREGARGVFYAVPGAVGATSSWDGDRARPLADWESLRLAQEQGHEIGNHSLTHPHLDRLTTPEQQREIEAADRLLREHGVEPASFCYPYGGLSERDAVPYPVGMALGRGPALDTDDLKRLPRIVMAYSDALPMLMYKLWIKPVLRR